MNKPLFTEKVAMPMAASTPRLPDATHLGPTRLRVSNLQQSTDFYTRVLGMSILPDANPVENQVTLGAGSTPLLQLEALPGARRAPGRSTGLFHVAILLPSRPDLGKMILNLGRHQYPIGGFGDHDVSEAMYLDDPDGNGLEIYRDRPRSEWQWNGSQVVMGTTMVDVQGVIESAGDPNQPFTGMPDGTTIGHIHLRVGDIPRAQAFYNGVLGFDIVAQMPSALFMSAGRYHHHIGANTWHSLQAPPPPANAVGLVDFTVIVPGHDGYAALLARLDAAGIHYQRRDNAALVDDPWGNRLRIVPA